MSRVAAMEENDLEVSRDRQIALAGCMEKLPQKDSDLVRRRYRRGGSVKAVSKEVGRSTHAIYKALARARRLLYDCMRTTLATEEGV